MSADRKLSRGHIGTRRIYGLEFYEQEGNVYAAPIVNPLDLEGYRQGGRWECTREHFDRYRAIFNLDQNKKLSES